MLFEVIGTNNLIACKFYILIINAKQIITLSIIQLHYDKMIDSYQFINYRFINVC